jgi:hypothetical protein
VKKVHRRPKPISTARPQRGGPVKLTPREQRETHHPARRQALAMLSNARELSKGDLAKRIYGRDDNSARAMTTRVTGALMLAGLLEERPEGQKRFARLTPRGREVAAEYGSTQRSVSKQKPLEIVSLTDPGPGEEHADDRPRFHLRHAALIALANLRPRDNADEHYHELLKALIDESSDPGQDLDAYYRLALSWPIGDPRRLLGECLARFQDPAQRGLIAEEVMQAAQQLQPGPDALLWASSAIEVARHLLLEGRSVSDGITARGILQQASRLMTATAVHPALAIAAEYRLAKADKVLGATRRAATVWAKVRDMPVKKAGADDPIGRAISAADMLVQRSAAFNASLEPFEEVLVKEIGPRVTRVLPSAEAIFRRRAGAGYSREVDEWVRFNVSPLGDVLRGCATEDGFRKTLATFQEGAKALRSTLAGVVAPHLRQVATLLAVGADSGAESSPSAVTEQRYDSLLLNNLWSPEMVALDAISAN